MIRKTFHRHRKFPTLLTYPLALTFLSESFQWIAREETSFFTINPAFWCAVKLLKLKDAISHLNHGSNRAPIPGSILRFNGSPNMRFILIWWSSEMCAPWRAWPGCRIWWSRKQDCRSENSWLTFAECKYGDSLVNFSQKIHFETLKFRVWISSGWKNLGSNIMDVSYARNHCHLKGGLGT